MSCNFNPSLLFMTQTWFEAPNLRKKAFYRTNCEGSHRRPIACQMRFAKQNLFFTGLFSIRNAFITLILIFKSSEVTL